MFQETAQNMRKSKPLVGRLTSGRRHCRRSIEGIGLFPTARRSDGSLADLPQIDGVLAVWEAETANQPKVGGCYDGRRQATGGLRLRRRRWRSVVTYRVDIAQRINRTLGATVLVALVGRLAEAVQHAQQLGQAPVIVADTPEQ